MQQSDRHVRHGTIVRPGRLGRFGL
jgi:hypothetical protein